MSFGRSIHASSERDDWRSPDNLLELVRAAFGGPIDLDPCAARDPAHWFARVNVPRPGTRIEGTRSKIDGLEALATFKPWTCYINPPYGRGIGRWVEAWARSPAKHAIALLPARTDTRWFAAGWAASNAACFLRGRLTFVGAPAPAPFPSVLLYRGTRSVGFVEALEGAGLVFRLIRNVAPAVSETNAVVPGARARAQREPRGAKRATPRETRARARRAPSSSPRTSSTH